MSANIPKLIVITPVRNESWVLEAFLTCASSWADYIIIADQHSTDDSREISLRYKKVTLIDNDSAEMNQALARNLLFEEVDKIPGDKIVFALDADEFLSEGFEDSEGWQKITKSSPNTIFCFRWLNLYGDFTHTLPDSGYYEWACHLDASMSLSETYRHCEQNAIHEMRVPCLPIEQANYIMIDDIRFIHLANLNIIRQRNKTDFYQVHTLTDRKERISAVSLYRTYNSPPPTIKGLGKEVNLKGATTNQDVRHLVKKGDVGQHYTDEIIQIFHREGYEKFKALCIWDNPDLQAAGVDYTPSFFFRLLHRYLKITQKQYKRLPVRILDRLLKMLV